MTLKPLRNDRITTAHVVAALFMGALAILATWQAWMEIYHKASGDEEYSHIFIVPVVVGVLIWVRRMRLRHCVPNGRIVGPIVVAIGWAIGSFGFYRGIQSFWEGGAVLVTLGCVLSVLGKNVIFRFFPAIAVLVFLVPAPGRFREAIAGPLQTWTASISQQIVQIIGVSNIQVLGNALWINGQRQPVLIAEACNGLRMVFPLFLICFTFSFALPLRNFARILILLASPLAAILCNVVRIVPTVLCYGYASPSFAEKFHDYAGWAMLPIAFLILYSIIKVLQWAMIPVSEYTLASQ